MTDYRIDAQLLRDMIVTAANYLEQNKQTLNDLNVFPVPDGDTGTNMLLTLVSAARDVNACELSTVGKVVAAMSGGALKGARGNSGVILSQLFRGYVNAIPPTKEYLLADDFASAVEAGVTAAYKAVMRPKEGTILTVAKAMAASARASADKGLGLLLLLDKMIEDGTAMLKRTPEFLPVLREAGVVDAGGAGLIIIYKGFKMAIDGEEVTSDLDLSAPIFQPSKPATSNEELSTADIEFGYCTEFFVKNLHKGVTDEHIEHLRDKLINLGDSVVVVGDSDLVKVHVHTNNPGKALQYALRLGDLSGVKIDNMREQHTQLIIKEEPQKPLAIVAVASGEGIADIYRDFNVDGIVEGGQSMNPSAQDIADEINKAPSNNVIVLPNNKNILLAAEQAAELTQKNVHVIPSKTFPQGLAAVLAFEPESSPEDNEKAMSEALTTVKSGQITKAVRDTKMNGWEIKKDDFLGICEDTIIAHGTQEIDVFEAMLKDMVTEDGSVISLYYGCDVTEEAAEKMRAFAEEKYPDCDVEMYSGGQPLYDYLVSVE